MKWLKKAFHRAFDTEHLVKENLKLGPMTPSKEAYRASLQIVLPAVAEMISIAFIGIANTAMVGVLGPYAISAVGLTGQPRMIFIALFFALNTGVTAIVSRRKGAGNQEEARLCLRQAVLVNIGLSVLMSILAVALSGPVMALAGANEDTLAASTEYFKIIGTGLIFQTLSMTLCAAQRGVGNTRITMSVNITANVVNVALNFLLITGRFGFPRLGVRGSAVATVIGSAVGLALAVRSVLRKDSYLRISIKDSWKPDIPMLKLMVHLGGGAIIEQMAMRIGFFVYARVVAGLGTNDFAAHQIAMQLMSLSFTFADGISVATTALVGQNLGKKRSDLSIMYGKIGQRFALIISIVLGTLSFTGRYWFPTLFTDEPDIIRAAAGVIIILAFIQPIQTSQIVMAGSLRGAGDVRFVAATMLITVAVVRPAVSLLLVNVFGLGLTGAWLSVCFDQTIRFLLLTTRFTGGRWVNIRV